MVSAPAGLPARDQPRSLAALVLGKGAEIGHQLHEQVLGRAWRGCLSLSLSSSLSLSFSLFCFKLTCICMYVYVYMYMYTYVYSAYTCLIPRTSLFCIHRTINGFHGSYWAIKADDGFERSHSPAGLKQSQANQSALTAGLMVDIVMLHSSSS